MIQSIDSMTREELEALPHVDWRERVECDSIIILPAKVCWYEVAWYRLRCSLARLLLHEAPPIWTILGLHSSGYRCMDFVAVREGEPICRLSGCSDVIHLDGIGGYGEDWPNRYGTVPDLVPPSAWSIDCLPQSGLLRMWPFHSKMVCGPALSSFEVFALERENEER